TSQPDCQRNTWMSQIRWCMLAGLRGQLKSGAPCRVENCTHSTAMRFACPFLWKAKIRDRELSADNLTLDRIMAIFTADLRRRSTRSSNCSPIHWPTLRGFYSCRGYTLIHLGV